MIYQAVISGLGEHIHIPIEAENDKEAYARAIEYAEQHFPRPMRGHVKVSPVKEGDQAQDDRAVLEFASVRKPGRPKERSGNYERITLEIRKDFLAMIDAQQQSRREYIERALEQYIKQQEK